MEDVWKLGKALFSIIFNFYSFNLSDESFKIHEALPKNLISSLSQMTQNAWFRSNFLILVHFCSENKVIKRHFSPQFL